jgi:hypothetical protein
VLAAAACCYWLLLVLAAAGCCCYEHGPACMNRHACCFSSSYCRCVHACAAAFVIDTIYQLTPRRRPERGELNFRIEIFEINEHGQKGELGGAALSFPELALLSVPINLVYIYTEF